MGKTIQRQGTGMSVSETPIGPDLKRLRNQHELIGLINHCVDPLAMLESLLSQISAGAELEAAWVWLPDGKSGNLQLKSYGGSHPILAEHLRDVPSSCDLIDYLLQGREVIDCWQRIWGEFGEPLAEKGWREVLVFPIQTEYGLAGALGVGTSQENLPQDLQMNLRTVAVSLAGRFSRERVEAHLRQSRHNLDTLFETFHDRVFIVDESGMILYSNSQNSGDAAAGDSGVDGRALRDVLSCPEHYPTNRGRLVGKDGLSVPVEIRDRAGRWDDVDVRYVLCRDITDRIEKEKEAERLSVAIEHLAEGIIITDAEGTIQYTNPAFTQVTGYSRQEALGQNPRLLKSGNHPPEFYRRMWNTLLEGSTWTGRLENRTKDGAVVLEEARVSPILDGDGKVTHFVAVKRDVTGEVAIERKLRESQKLEAIGTLAGGIAHDFNNILYALSGYAQLALDELKEQDPVHSYLMEIAKAGDRASDLVTKMLAFGQRADTATKETRIQDVVSEALDLARASLPATIEFRIDLDADCPAVTADATQIHQVILNLCTNAEHAMRQTGGIFRVHLEAVDLDREAARNWPKLSSGKWAKLVVSDTGIGMDRALKERIFEPYFTTKKSNEGTGLGLATVHGIITNHGGRIYVDSAPDEGTNFTIFLPLCGRESTEPVQETSPEPMSGCGRILLIDDEEMIVDVTVKGLTRLGFEVTGLLDGVQAVEIFRNDPFGYDAIVTDQTMPGITGFEVAAKVLAIRPDMPIILTTGYSDVGAEENVMEAGIRRLLTKPVKIRDLAEALEGFISACAVT
jgi:PAS domain S-box-containing protein